MKVSKNTVVREHKYKATFFVFPNILNTFFRNFLRNNDNSLIFRGLEVQKKYYFLDFMQKKEPPG